MTSQKIKDAQADIKMALMMGSAITAFVLEHRLLWQMFTDDVQKVTPGAEFDFPTDLQAAQIILRTLAESDHIIDHFVPAVAPKGVSR